MDAKYRKQIEQLYYEMYDRLKVYARSSLNNEDAAEEAVQETFRIACQKPDSVCNSPNPKGWIFNTLKNTIRNIRSSQASAKNLIETYQLLYSHELEHAEDHPSLELLYGNTKNSEDLTLLIEMAIEGRTHAEMAAKRGISINACKKRVQRAKENLQKMLKSLM